MNMTNVRLDKILDGKFIKPVYQPIVSLIDGEVWAYEALSRISNDELKMNIEELFITADSSNRAWELEALCRSRALEGFAKSSHKEKLFLNVNPNVLYDEKFKSGFTKNRLEELGISADDIIFEITERVSILHNNLFFNSVEHYRKQNYGIAIDDVGSGFSGLNVIVNVKPTFIKLDMHLIRDIDKDETKYLLCKALNEFCKGAGIKIIAEGIESEEELRQLISLGIDFGQGYYLGMPQDEPKSIAIEKAQLITSCVSKYYKEKLRTSIYPTIENLCKKGYTVSQDEKAGAIYEILMQNPTIMEFAVVNSDLAVGFLTRTTLNSILGGRYGYSLYSSKPIKQLLKQEFLRVNGDMTVDHVARLAMQRPYDRLYNPIVVERNGKYLGMVTIKDLLNTCTKIEVDAAMHSNPLTNLPGNLLIEKEIEMRIFSDNPYCITYYDLDNFKAYNDAYGFENGDLMLKLVADILLKNTENDEFVGHIGGDDFIVIADYENGQEFCDLIIECFSEQINSLYHEEDIKNGYIISKNRNGVTESFPIASISIAGITSKGKKYKNVEEFSKDAAMLKKKSKQQLGNFYSFI